MGQKSLILQIPDEDLNVLLTGFQRCEEGVGGVKMNQRSVCRSIEFVLAQMQWWFVVSEHERFRKGWSRKGVEGPA